MARIGVPIVALVALTAVVLIAYGISTAAVGPDTVTGHVVSVEPISVTTISSLTLEDDSGKLWTFEGGGTFAGFTPSHLEEHMALSEQVTVEYEETSTGTLKIPGLRD